MIGGCNITLKIIESMREKTENPALRLRLLDLSESPNPSNPKVKYLTIRNAVWEPTKEESTVIHPHLRGPSAPESPPEKAGRRSPCVRCSKSGETSLADTPGDTCSNWDRHQGTLPRMALRAVSLLSCLETT